MACLRYKKVRQTTQTAQNTWVYAATQIIGWQLCYHIHGTRGASGPSPSRQCRDLLLLRRVFYCHIFGGYGENVWTRPVSAVSWLMRRASYRSPKYHNRNLYGHVMRLGINVFLYSNIERSIALACERDPSRHVLDSVSSPKDAMVCDAQLISKSMDRCGLRVGIVSLACVSVFGLGMRIWSHTHTLNA